MKTTVTRQHEYRYECATREDIAEVQRIISDMITQGYELRRCTTEVVLAENIANGEIVTASNGALPVTVEPKLYRKADAATVTVTPTPATPSPRRNITPELRAEINKYVPPRKAVRKFEPSLTRIKQMRKFWAYMQPHLGPAFANRSLSNDYWWGGEHIPGVGHLTVWAGRSYCSVDIWVNRPSHSDTKAVFDSLFALKDQIEADYGDHLVWVRGKGKVARIRAMMPGKPDAYNKKLWPEMQKFIHDAQLLLKPAIDKALVKIQKKSH